MKILAILTILILTVSCRNEIHEAYRGGARNGYKTGCIQASQRFGIVDKEVIEQCNFRADKYDAQLDCAQYPNKPCLF